MIYSFHLYLGQIIDSPLGGLVTTCDSIAACPTPRISVHNQQDTWICPTNVDTINLLMINHWDISNILSQIPRTQMGAGRHGAPQGRGSDSQAPRCLWCLLAIELWRISRKWKVYPRWALRKPQGALWCQPCFFMFFPPLLWDDDSQSVDSWG